MAKPRSRPTRNQLRKRSSLYKPVEEKHTCLNCETKFSGNFCPECGQSIKEYNPPLSFLLVDMAGNLFAFDTRFWSGERSPSMKNPGLS